MKKQGGCLTYIACWLFVILLIAVGFYVANK